MKNGILKKLNIIMEHEIKLYGYGKNNIPITTLYGYGKNNIPITKLYGYGKNKMPNTIYKLYLNVIKLYLNCIKQ